MTFLARLRSWVRSLSRRARIEQEIDDELSFHIDQYAADLVRRGLPEADARRRARAEFGGIAGRKEECREALGLRLVDEVGADLRYAFRQLRRSPAFTAVAALSLALGLGANAAIFSLMETALWMSIPVPDPERLRLFTWVSGPNRVMNGINGNLDQTPGGGASSESFSYPVFLQLQKGNEAFEAVFAFKPIGRVTAVIEGNPELLLGQLISGNFYEGIGIHPIVGRPIVQSDDDRGAEAVAVISHGLWARRFASDPSVVGSRININAIPVTIVGVNPPGFTGVEPGQHPDVFLPLSLQPVAWQRRGDVLLNNADVWWVLVMGRLKADADESGGQAHLDVVLQQAVNATLPARGGRDRPRLRLESGARGLDGLSGDYRRPLLVLLSLVAVVLLIACANVANLLLARATARQREISLRLALGAGRWRVCRQLLTEGFALALLGGGAGVLLGFWMRDAIPALLATSWQPGPFQAEFNGRVVGLSVAATVTTGILFSLAPAWRSARLEINTALKDAGRESFRLPRWWRGKPLVVFQVCLSVLLLIGAGLFVRTLWNLGAVNLGFEPDRVLLFTLDPPRTRYPGEERNALFDRIHERIGAVPGIEAVSLSSATVLDGGSSQTGVATDLANPGSRRLSFVNEVGYDFFETMGIPILAGRALNRTDRVGTSPVVVVNQQFVREFYPDQNPLGKSFRNGSKVVEIVGVSADAKYSTLRTPFPPTFYSPYLQMDPGELGAMTFEVRTALGQDAVVKAIREAVRTVDNDLPVFDVRTQNEQIDATISQERLFVTLTSTFAGLAVLLACIGIYGILANGVARRTHEIGIRIALGAERRRLLWMILREGALLAALGAVAGIAAALALTRYVRGMLFGVAPADPLTMAFAVALIFVVALLAGWVPARRAAHLEPMDALRHE